MPEQFNVLFLNEISNRNLRVSLNDTIYEPSFRFQKTCLALALHKLVCCSFYFSAGYFGRISQTAVCVKAQLIKDEETEK